jgi:hypothetical protein
VAQTMSSPQFTWLTFLLVLLATRVLVVPLVIAGLVETLGFVLRFVPKEWILRLLNLA